NDNTVTTAPTSENNTPTKTSAVLLSDTDTYNKAFRALSAKHYDDAQSQFNGYLKLYPKGHFAENAYFWLGEIDLMKGKYNAALKRFQIVVSDYPHAKKLPDAKLKIAMIHAATGKVSIARDEFTKIRKDYPGSTAAQLANIRLQQLASATSVETK
ncbi:MAG TPA: tol-pal system protein YbgF, partial [Gammaproteobacteria bacterium]|nr:tol-pal system protein YbgF [Gammaproteobacteria bacterium]